MSWERRGNHLYYFRAFRRRQDRKLIKQYFGRGPRAVAAAEEDAARRAARAELRKAEQEQRQAYDVVAGQVLAVSGEVGAIVEMVLTLAGYHRNRRGPWRCKRAKGKT